MVNPFTHFYLYAKQWYKQSENKIEDLKILMHEYSGTPIEYISENDIYDRLMSLIWEELNKTENPEYTFRKFTSNVQNVGLVDACLRILSISKADGRNLGRPDFNLLSHFDELAYKNANDSGYNWTE